MKRIITILFIFLFATNTSILAQDAEEQEYLDSPFQFTFMFPPLSTNGIKNSKTVNNVSLNLFIGNSGGLDGFEVGSFINSDNYFVNGVQLAGFGNVVAGRVTGTQLSGFLNINAGSTGPFQAAGFINVVGSDVNGCQLAGFLNTAIAGAEGAQLAGFANISGAHITGFQGAGFINIAGTAVTGAQVAGFVNVAPEVTNGVQIAGFANIAPVGLANAQVGGFLNKGRNILGIQAAGFGNVAKDVRGIQIAGFFNYCDSIDGIPIGFINIVKKNGYRKFEFSISETQYAVFTFKMGIRYFYNIYSLGKPAGSGNRWLLGAGIGTELDMNPQMVINIEALAHQELWIAESHAGRLLHTDRLNMLNQVRTTFGYKPSERITLFGGPTLNISVAETDPGLGYFNWHEIGPNWGIYDHTSWNLSQTHVKIWFGIMGGVRF